MQLKVSSQLPGGAFQRIPNPYNGIERFLTVTSVTPAAMGIHTMELKDQQHLTACSSSPSPSNPYNGIERAPLGGEKREAKEEKQESIQWN